MFISISDKTAKMFSNCSDVPITVEIEDNLKFSHIHGKKFRIL